MAVLYRKYRPQTFADVLNQKSIIQTLKNQVKSGSVSHAYLFTGSRGVGKTSVARILAKAVNCEVSRQQTADSNLQGEACGQCGICKQIEAGNFLDLVEIDAASNTGVDNIRELIEHVKFSPSIGKYKVFIIDEVHMLSRGAFNALLKTLEEPPAHAIFVMATTEINKVPATIVSRTQKFDFKALSAADIFSHLEKICREEKISLELAVLDLVAQNAEGSVRDALSLLDKVFTLGQQASLADCQQLLGITDIAVCENLLELIALGNIGEIPGFYGALTEKGLDYGIFNRDFLEFLRKVLVYKISEGRIDFGLPQEHKEKIKNLAEKFSSSDLVFTIRLFLKSYKDLQSSPDAQIPLLVASIEAAVRKSVVSKQQTANSRPEPTRTEQPIVQSKIVEQNPVALNDTADPVEELAEMDMAEAERLWPKVIAKVKEINGPLASLLRNLPLVGVEGGRIIVNVKFKFDKQSLENQKNAGLICGLIKELSGKQMGLLAQVVKAEAGDVVSSTQALGDALKVFGGELVE